ESRGIASVVTRGKRLPAGRRIPRGHYGSTSGSRAHGSGACVLTPTPSLAITSQSPDGPTAPAPVVGHDKPTSLPESPGLPVATFTFPNRILFGAGARGLLTSELGRLGVARPLIVTDSGLLASGLIGPVLALLGKPAVVHSAVQA